MPNISLHPIFIANALQHAPQPYMPSREFPIQIHSQANEFSPASATELSLQPSTSASVAAFDLHVSTSSILTPTHRITNLRSASYYFTLQSNHPLLAFLPTLPPPYSTPLYSTLNLTLEESLVFLLPTFDQIPQASAMWPYPLSITSTPRWPSTNPQSTTLSIRLHSHNPSQRLTPHPLNPPLTSSPLEILSPTPYWGTPSTLFTMYIPTVSCLPLPIPAIRTHILTDRLLTYLQASNSPWVLADVYYPTPDAYPAQLAFTLIPNKPHPHQYTQLLAQSTHVLLYHTPSNPFPLNTPLPPEQDPPYKALSSLFPYPSKIPPQQELQQVIQTLNTLANDYARLHLAC